MPYLKQVDKRKLEHIETQIIMTEIDTPGQLNYLVTLLAKQALKRKEVNYTLLNGIIGALDCAKEEFRRRVVNPYEDTKIKLNGDVYGKVELHDL